MSISRSIILVDDELELACIFKEFLKNEGSDVVSFTDPVLALEYYKETADKHSLIITDLRMPGICGIDLAKNMTYLVDSTDIPLSLKIVNIYNNMTCKVMHVTRRMVYYLLTI